MKVRGKGLVLRSVSIVLVVLCIGVVTIPPNLVHSHKEADLKCESSNLLLESDLCHVSIYHPQDVSKKHCEHKNHIDNKFSKCEFCKFLSTQKKQFIDADIDASPGQIELDRKVALSDISALPTPIIISLGRAPPAH